MTIEFKPGDRVKCVESYLPGRGRDDDIRGAIGQIYTVEALGDWPVTMKLKELPFSVAQSRFTLHAKAGEFVVGDKVVCDAAYGEYEPFAAGTVYEIKRFYIDRHGDKYVTVDHNGTGWDAARFRLATPKEFAAASAPAPTYKRGDTVLARATLEDDIDENDEFYVGYLKAEAIVSLEAAAMPLIVGDRVTDSYLAGLIVFQQGSESVIDGDNGEGLVVRENIDLVRA